MTRRLRGVRVTPGPFILMLLSVWWGLGEPRAQSGVSAPVPMWQYGGCISGPWCQTGWYSSPAVADLDGDGQPEVVWGAYDVVALNGSSGTLKWRAPSGNRVWPGVSVADLTGDGTLEVIAGRSADQLTVYNRLGGTIWTRSPFGSGEIRSLAVEDLEGDGTLEIVVGHAGGGSYQVNVLEPDGTTRSGWPARHAGEPGFGTGLWNQNLAVADMNGDGLKEVLAPTGGHYITALNRNGTQLGVNGIFAPRQYWSQVGTNVDHAVDVRGWTECGVEHRPTFTDSAPVVADVNADGVPELVVVGNIQDCSTQTGLYYTPFIFNLDRTRWSGSGFDWTVIPAPGPDSAPRSEDFNVIDTAVPNPVVADLDGDGFKEILFPSYDGRVHAYWLDKTEHGSWPYTVPTSGAAGDDFRFASEPAVVDLNNDGRAEVIFASWPKKDTGRVGQLHIVSDQGAELHRIDLPAPDSDGTWNGALSAPTIANIDSDPDLKVVLGTVASGVVAYKLPNTANARILWGTGRGNDGRTGVPVITASAPPPDATPPDVGITSPANGATVSGTVTVSASASDDVGVAGVRVLVNGTAVGAEDTTAPYAIAWDTTDLADGSHTLTAVARDEAGNTTTSTPVVVTVANAPADTTVPGVAITSPAAGATVAGTVTISASASDNVGVTGVRFFVDGTPVGAEDTTAPYAVAWDTTGVSDGGHTLTAVARDAAGNTATSAASAVTVANAPPPAVARFEETAAAVVPAESWFVVTSTGIGAPLSGDRAVFSQDAGATATFPFTGTGVSWLGVRCEVCGIARVRLDGVLVATVDAFAPPPRSAAVMFSASGLAAGSHSLVIEVSGTMNASSGGPFIVVDAFDVTSGGPAPGDTTAPTVTMTAPVSGASVAGTVTVSADASDAGGVAGVRFFVDGVAIGTEDTTAPYAVAWNTTTVGDGSHTLTAVARDTSANTATSAPVTVTAANGAPAATTRFEETAATLTPFEDWFLIPESHPSLQGADLSGDQAVTSGGAGARATFTFTGTGVSWIGLTCPECGIANVYVNGVQVATLDTYAPTWPDASSPMFTRTGLAAGTHTLVVEATFMRHPSSTNAFVVVDAFDVTP